ncbi:MAG TPA: 2-oxo-4-hydroxy-4-carboxy-5-ureidoimidazoline decarboxylase, partial [Macromonas sp.]|nr:2-oxo-4-hydroxy-4-carboxy-5-ureidoimidazoline decarboxylase [Macromonas sp.]
MPLTLDQLNTAPLAEAVRLLDGLYEHSPWIVEQALAQRPFASLAALQQACIRVLDAAGAEAQTTLIRAHPELAGKAMVAQTLTDASTSEQQSAGLTHCSPAEFARLQQLNTDYNARFGWPFILAVRGPRGTGLTRQQIIASFERRLHDTPAREHAECLRQIHRIAELRLQALCGVVPRLGQQVWDWHEQLARFSEAPDALTVTYLSEAHQACARQIAVWMREAGFDEVHTDAVGNVVGRYHAQQPDARCLLTGSHYDTVRNAGKYDGRLGILAPLMAVRELHAAGQRLPFGIELVAFAEEEGQRFPVTFLGSSALVGAFPSEWLDQHDADGISLRQAMQAAGL